MSELLRDAKECGCRLVAFPSPAALLEGEVPSVFAEPLGCPFASQCSRKIGPICDDERPVLRALTTSGHSLACHQTLALD